MTDLARSNTSDRLGGPPWSRSGVSRAAVRGVAWTGLQYWGYNVLALGVFVVLGRLLRPSDFGLAAAANTVILFLRVVVDAGFSRLLVQRTEITEDQVDTAFWTALGIGVIFAAITVVAAPLIALLFGMPRLTNVIRVLSVVFILVGLDSTQSALLERQMRFSAQAVRRLIAAFASAGVAVAMAVDGFGVWALVGQQVVLEATTVLILWRLSTWRPARRFVRSCWRELATFGTRYSVMRVLWYLGQNVDNFLVGIFLGPIALGYYVVAYRVLVVLNELFNTTISSVSLSTFSKLRHDKDSINGALYEATSMLAAIGLPIYAGLAVVAHPLLTAVFGAKWAPSAPVLEALTLAGAVQSLSACISSYTIAIGLVRYEMWSVLCVVAAEVAGFVLTVHLGLVAVALALGIVLAIAWPIRLLLLRRWGGVSLRSYVHNLPAVFVASLIMAGGVAAVGVGLAHSEVALRLTAQIATGAALYPLTLWCLAPALVHRLRDKAGQLLPRNAA